MALTDVLHQTFGFPAFRANQEAVCQAATEGSDVLLVMPTGAGKSLCYQLPAVARGGTALVVSPLIALMDDQASKLQALGLRVARIHSGLSRDQSREACRDYLDGKLQFLLIAPERMRVPGFPEMLARRKPSLVAIDEAHCISAWGHDFRPDYRMLGDFLPALRPAPIVALTATATPAVQKDIVTQLALRQPKLFIHGFRRDNLAVEVMELSKPQRSEFITKFLDQKERRPAIVYAPSRKTAEELAHQLKKRFASAAYHAGLEAGTRERAQRDFQSGRLEVVVATIAFGMGIDKADVRTVIHYALPASVESYYQEIGRAGRDGLPSRTVLLYSFADRRMHDFFLERDYPVATELTRIAKILTTEAQMPAVLRQRLKMDVETFDRAAEKLAAQGAASIDIAGNIKAGTNSSWQSGYTQQLQFRRSQIDRMMAFATTQQCRMTALIRHFGDTADAHRPCNHCDFCNPEATQAQTFAAPSFEQDLHLRKILRTLEGGISKSTGKLFTELALTKDRNEFEALLDGLARAGLIAIENTTFTNTENQVIPYKKASLTHEGAEVDAHTPLGVMLRTGSENPNPSKPRSRRTTKAAASVAVDLSPVQKNLEQSLREWRKAEATSTGKPAFLVCSDAALNALVQAMPGTIPQLLAVPGFGPHKVEQYGAKICAICRGESAPLAAPPSPRPAVTESPKPAVFKRERTTQLDPSESLDLNQRELEGKLQAWRKSESEKMGLPQFFVLGASALRSIVLARPRTSSELLAIHGVGPEKLERFGASILEVCNA